LADFPKPPRKFFPRNLTARWELVRGNPVNARPESGVDNAHPGIEFDSRALNRVFFPGLVFDFYYKVGARVVDVKPDLFELPGGLTQDDIETQQLFLWYIVTFPQQQPALPQFTELYGRDGYEVIRTVTTLDPGRLTIVIGPKPGNAGLPKVEDLVGILKETGEAAAAEPRRNIVLRNAERAVQLAVLFGHRETYLNEDGVIRTDLIKPGELTQTLCSPWQWDFAECGCFYWAGSKPDIVTARDQTEQISNFQRVNRDRPIEAGNSQSKLENWVNIQLTPPQMIRQWETLPFVVAERETDSHQPRQWPAPVESFDRERVAKELGYLATVEHAVLVQYLFASYSVNTPQMDRDPGNPRGLTLSREDLARLSPEEKRSFAVSREILMIALDEMRHLRWVNEARQLLGQPPVLGRAKEIGRTERNVKLPFVLEPLTKKKLDEFINIEQPSRRLYGDPDGLEGLYIQILLSIHAWPDEVLPKSERERLMELIKLIIDEGDDHWKRLLAVQKHLEGITEEKFLRVTKAPEPSKNPDRQKLQELADAYYDTVLQTLGFALKNEDRSGNLLNQSRNVMFNLHEVADYLASEGDGILFTLPPWTNVTEDDYATRSLELVSVSDSAARSLKEPDPYVTRGLVHKLLSELGECNTPRVSQMARRHRTRI
jgi:Ferritin-like